MATHFGLFEKEIYECKICDYVTLIKEKFIEHILTPQNYKNTEMATDIGLFLNRQFSCEQCNFESECLLEFHKHVLTPEHCIITKNLKTPYYLLNGHNVYICSDCNYFTLYRGDYTKHLITKKHKNKCGLSVNIDINSTPKCSNQKVSNKHNCICGKEYIHKSSLYKHIKHCKYKEMFTNKECISDKNENIDDSTKEKTNDTINDVVSENNYLKKLVENLLHNQNELMDKHNECINTINDMVPKIGNVTNNNININVFLNEQCKDALNIHDFVNSIKIQIEDLETIKNNSLESGINNIFTKALNDIDIYKRPIHCMDNKRKTLYIKDNNRWNIDNEYKTVKKNIHKLVDKQRQSIKQWELENPEWEKSEELQTEYAMLVKNSMYKLDDIKENKIIKNIADTVICDTNNCTTDNKEI